MEAPDFWNDPEVSQNKMKEVKSLKDDVATYAALSAQYDDIETMIEMGYEENDPELIPEIDQMMKEFVQTYEDIRMKTLLSGEYDRNNAIVSLHAGAGGTESCDWAAMLYRMYTRWADKKGFSAKSDEVVRKIISAAWSKVRISRASCMPVICGMRMSSR